MINVHFWTIFVKDTLSKIQNNNYTNGKLLVLPICLGSYANQTIKKKP